VLELVGTVAIALPFCKGSRFRELWRGARHTHPVIVCRCELTVPLVGPWKSKTGSLLPELFGSDRRPAAAKAEDPWHSADQLCQTLGALPFKAGACSTR
jgi:hypothetical protein